MIDSPISYRDFCSSVINHNLVSSFLSSPFFYSSTSFSVTSSSLVGQTVMLIPNDVVVEILSRLPAKSLSRLRWACKYWFDLITRDDGFSKMHIHHSTTHDEFFNIISLSLLHTSSDSNKVFQCYLKYNNITRVGDVSREVCINLPIDYFLGCRPKIMGSCNGLILLFNIQSEDLCIWNACTKEYSILPRPLNREGDPYLGYIREYNYGFGYDHTNDDYKVIRNICYNNVGHGVKLVSYSDVQVYTLRTNSWRRIKPNPYRLRARSLSQGVFSNGVLYWIDCFDHNIISFDFETKKFQHVSTIPNISRHDHANCYVRIQVFEGSLCVVLNIKDQPYYYGEIWMMNVNAMNNNNESLWTNVLTIPSNTVKNNNNECEPLRCTRNDVIHFVEPLRCIRNGDILMLTNQRDLVLYDRKSNNGKILYKNICKEDSHYVIHAYTESLVSLKSGTYKSQEEDDGVEK